MPAKSEIIERLGETAVLLPGLIADGLAANERAKLRLTLLQEAVAGVGHQGAPLRDFTVERRAAGLDDPVFDTTVSGARAVGAGCYAVPAAKRLIVGLYEDVAAMLVPLTASGAGDGFATRLEALQAASPQAADDILKASDVTALTSARRGDVDSVHLLIMDLHRALNRLAAETAVETLDGASVHRLDAGDRPRVAAFMRGLNRTAHLAFGHPGLGTTATRSGNRLVIQNDIGTTDAHVLVVHVEARTVTMTYTDIHRLRAKFFTDLFAADDVVFSPLTENNAAGLGPETRFVLVTGIHHAADDAALDGFLGRLASRIVFLIDWNKARKALQTFVDKGAAIEVLRWAATHECGHRAFIELGGANLVFEAIRHVASSRVPYGARLDGVLGAAETAAFLKRMLRIAADGLTAERSARLIRDEVEAELTQCFETAENAFYAILLRHLGLSRMLAGAIADAFSVGWVAAAPERQAIAATSKRLEHKADQLTVEARDLAGRLLDPRGHLRPVLEAVENATDMLDEAAFLLSLFPNDVAGHFGQPLAAIAETALTSVSDLVRAVESAARLPDGVRVDAADALQAIDAVVGAEKRADDALRDAMAAMVTMPDQAGPTFVGIELARALETSTDHLARAALGLRDRVIEELSA